MTALPTTRVGAGGWVRLLLPELDAPVVFVRFQAAANGTLKIHEVYARAEGDEGESAPLPFDEVRRLPFEKLEVWANSRQVTSQIIDRLQDPCPEPALDLAWFQLDVHAEDLPEGVAGTWVESSRLAQAGQEKQAERPLDRELEARAQGNAREQSPLDIPTSRPFPDSFYEHVAKLYREATLETSKPVALLAKVHGVKASTVHGWVAKARARGYLESHGQGRTA